MNVRDLPKVVLTKGSQRLVEAWSGWRRDRLLPRKTDMDLSALAEFMPWLALVEVLDADIARMRVAGSSLSEVYGMEMTGRSLKEVTAPADWPRRSARYQAQVGHPCGSYYFRRDTLPEGKVVSYETVALPVDADVEGRQRHMLCVISPLQHWYELDGPPSPHVVPMATDFRFVDIGAGRPETRLEGA